MMNMTKNNLTDVPLFSVGFALSTIEALCLRWALCLGGLLAFNILPKTPLIFCLEIFFLVLH